MKIIRNTIAVCLLFCISIAIFSACEKVEIGENIPQCIKKQIKKEAGPCLGSVIEYIEISNETKSRIYRFEYGSIHCFKEPVSPNIIFYDEQCNPIEVTIKDHEFFEYNNHSHVFNRFVYQYYIK